MPDNILRRAVEHMGCNCGEFECFTSEEQDRALKLVEGAEAGTLFVLRFGLIPHGADPTIGNRYIFDRFMEGDRG